MNRLLVALAVCLLLHGLSADATTVNTLGPIVIPLSTTNGGTGATGPAPVALTDASPIVVSAPAPYGTFYTISLTTAVGATRVVGNPASLAAGQYLIFTFLEDGSGAEQITWGTDYNFMGSPSVNTAVNAKTTFFCVSDTASTLQCANYTAASPNRSTASTSDSPTAADCGGTITFTASTAIAVTLPTTAMPQPWCWMTMVQIGAGKVTPTISAAAPRNNHSWTGSQGQYAVITVGTPDGGTTWYLTGDAS